MSVCLSAGLSRKESLSSEPISLDSACKLDQDQDLEPRTEGECLPEPEQDQGWEPCTETESHLKPDLDQEQGLDPGAETETESNPEPEQDEDQGLESRTETDQDLDHEEQPSTEMDHHPESEQEWEQEVEPGVETEEKHQAELDQDHGAELSTERESTPEPEPDPDQQQGEEPGREMGGMDVEDCPQRDTQQEEEEQHNPWHHRLGTSWVELLDTEEEGGQEQVCVIGQPGLRQWFSLKSEDLLQGCDWTGTLDMEPIRERWMNLKYFVLYISHNAPGPGLRMFRLSGRWFYFFPSNCGSYCEGETGNEVC